MNSSVFLLMRSLFSVRTSSRKRTSFDERNFLFLTRRERSPFIRKISIERIFNGTARSFILNVFMIFPAFTLFFSVVFNAAFHFPTALTSYINTVEIFVTLCRKIIKFSKSCCFTAKEDKKKKRHITAAAGGSKRALHLTLRPSSESTPVESAHPTLSVPYG